jgi:CHAD domain-containing protein
MAKSVLERKFHQNQGRVDKRLKAYLAEPESERNIHNVRTSLRRLDATFFLLPKKVRRRYRGRVEKYRQFLKASSKARDCDIIAGRISTLGDIDTADLQRKKKAELAKITKLARPLKKLSPMLLVNAPECRRIDKVVRRLVEEIAKALPPVLSDSKKVDELHRLRKNFRKLRYILEMIPAEDRKWYMRKAVRTIGRDIVLREMQALLGLIHDSDITIDYLRSKGNKQFLNREIGNRMQLYKKFVRYMKN